MCDALAHRGPDGEGLLIDDEGRSALGHRRLSIIDLSTTGAQPMSSASGRYEIVFNGEIYGFLNLRRQLEAQGAVFRGRSDTEVLLAAVEAYGVEQAVTRLNGMFAFALLDRARREMVFARDRLGKKPLYVGVGAGALVFCSELKALRAHPAFSEARIDRSALALYLRCGYVPGTRAIYENVFKIQPGSMIAVPIDREPNSAEALSQGAAPFWSLYDVAERGAREPITDEVEALALIEERLRVATRDRIVADVPVGAFLSGGIDSSLVCAIMREVSPSRPRTFTIRFLESDQDEAAFAAAIARHLDTEHTELTATPDAALSVVGDLPETFDEPFSDPSQVPTLLVSKLAREQVTVALSGDGGDESFGGYSRYARMMMMERLASRTPSILLNGLRGTPAPWLDVALRLAFPVLPKSLRDEGSGDRLKKMAEVMSRPDFRGRYIEFLSQWPAEILPERLEPPTTYTSEPVPEELGSVERMMFLDTVGYLPDDVLVKVDRASMAVGLEIRSPLLDHGVVEAAWQAPSSLRVHGVEAKVALRRLLAQRVPKSLFDRPKRGFGVPINAWLRGPFRDMASFTFSADRLREIGLSPQIIVERWNEHLGCKRNWGAHLWTILMYERWHRRWMKSGSSPAPF